MQRRALNIEIVVERCEFLGLLLFLLLDILFRVVNDEKLVLGLHLAADEAAVECAVPLLLVLFRLKLHIDVEPFLILLYGEHDEDIGLRVIIYILNLMQFDALEALGCNRRLKDAQLVGFEHHQASAQLVDHDIQVGL